MAERRPRILSHTRLGRGCSIIPGWATARASFGCQQRIGHGIGCSTRQPMGISPCAWLRFGTPAPAPLQEEKYQGHDRSKASCPMISLGYEMLKVEWRLEHTNSPNGNASLLAWHYNVVLGLSSAIRGVVAHHGLCRSRAARSSEASLRSCRRRDRSVGGRQRR